MGRNFDGTDDNVSLGSDASVDNLFASAKTVSFYLKRGATGFQDVIGKHTEPLDDGWFIAFRGPGGSHLLRFEQAWSLGVGFWDSTTGFSSTTDRNHFAIAYNGASLTNDPAIYVNGVAETVVEAGTPLGTLVSDAAHNLKVGESHDGASDLNAVVGWLCIAPEIWTAAQVNRARWWGRPGGGLNVYHPLVTDKLANEGSATANGTATGTTVVPLAVPVVRPGSAMMGLGVGW